MPFEGLAENEKEQELGCLGLPLCALLGLEYNFSVALGKNNNTTINKNRAFCIYDRELQSRIIRVSYITELKA